MSEDLARRPDGQGLSSKELANQQAEDLPDREAMSLVDISDINLGVAANVDVDALVNAPINANVDVDALVNAPIDANVGVDVDALVNAPIDATVYAPINANVDADIPINVGGEQTIINNGD